MGDISPLLAVRDMRRTITFYKDYLGFKMGMAFPDADSPEYADLSKDGMVLMFIPAQNHGIDIGEKLGIGVNIYMNIDGDIAHATAYNVATQTIYHEGHHPSHIVLPIIPQKGGSK